MKKYIYLLIFAGLLLSCGKNKTDNQLFAYESNDLQEDVEATLLDENAQIDAQKIIRNASLRFSVKDLSETEQFIIQLTNDYQGYIQEQEINEYDNSTQVYIPAKNFDQYLQKIKSKAETIISQRISTENVTSQFIDIQAHIKNKKELEAVYTDLLKKSKTVEEILEIQRAINEIRTEIESTEGRLKYLEHNTKYSLINLRYFSETSKTQVGDSFWKKWKEAFTDGADMFGEFIIAISHLWVFFIVLIGILLTVFYTLKRKNKKQKL
ncbi:DUF4349 domain-containing protein [Capnocytophaga canimorsus]|uniref:DUF4349 domain-containing protein n=1 Tax=Capnocytophaga canimorsus TaxID=28188 RepID=UPI0038582C93